MFITFEGIDGAGKSTLINLLSEHLTLQKIPHIVVREPGEGPVGNAIRDVIMNHDLTPEAEFLLFQSARAETIRKVIIPALENDVIVLCDRFIHSTYAYQGGGRGVSSSLIDTLDTYVTEGLKPDVTFFIDITSEESDIRSQVKDVNRFDTEKREFKETVRKTYMEYADDFIILDGMKSPIHLLSDITPHIKRP